MGITTNLNDQHNGMTSHTIPVRLLSLPPNGSQPKIPNQVNFLHDTLAPLRTTHNNNLNNHHVSNNAKPHFPTHVHVTVSPAPTCHTHEAHPKVVQSKSLHGVFQNRLSGPLAALQHPTQGMGGHSRITSVRTPRGVKRASRNGRWKMKNTNRDLSREILANMNNKENHTNNVQNHNPGQTRLQISHNTLLGNSNNTTENNNSNQAKNLHQSMSMPITYQENNNNEIMYQDHNNSNSMNPRNEMSTNEKDRWLNDPARITSALNQLVKLCDATQHNQIHNSNQVPGMNSINNNQSHHSMMDRRPPKPLPSNIQSQQESEINNRINGLSAMPIPDCNDSRERSITSIVLGSNSCDRDDSRRGMAKRVGVVLKALGGRLFAWGKGEQFNNWSQVSSHHSSENGRLKGE